MSSDHYGTSTRYARKEAGYREKALKLYPGYAEGVPESLSIQICVN